MYTITEKNTNSGALACSLLSCSDNNALYISMVNVEKLYSVIPSWWLLHIQYIKVAFIAADGLL